MPRLSPRCRRPTAEGQRWRRLAAGLTALLLTSPPTAKGESDRVPLVLREGLLYVPVRLIGCVQKPDLELLLDTGSDVTVLPQPQMKRMSDRRTALPLGDMNIEFVDGGATEAHHFLVDGLRIGTCDLPAVHALACPSERTHWRLVLGMDVLRRLEDLRIEIRSDGGELIFSCPPEPSTAAGECGEP